MSEELKWKPWTSIDRERFYIRKSHDDEANDSYLIMKHDKRPTDTFFKGRQYWMYVNKTTGLLSPTNEALLKDVMQMHNYEVYKVLTSGSEIQIS